MTSTAIEAIKPASETQQIVAIVLDGLTSEHSKRAYRKALEDFLAWYAASGKPGLSKATVQAYKVQLQTRGLSASTVNQAMSAIRKLAQEAADNGLMDAQLANGIAKVQGVKSAGVRAGNWLTLAQAQELLNTPDTNTIKGIRDRAILAVMLGCGLRRSELAALTWQHIQQREGRWVIVDMLGKGKRVRTIPMPSWAKAALDAWSAAAGVHSGCVFLAINKGGRVNGAGMTAQAVHDVVIENASRLDYQLAAHDLRRTFAKLAHKGGAGLDQIQLSLGHASIKTTERYLGISQDLADAPCDRLGLRL